MTIMDLSWLALGIVLGALGQRAAAAIGLVLHYRQADYLERWSSRERRRMMCRECEEENT